MPRVIYIEPNEVRHEIEVDDGMSVMEGAVQSGIDGIVAECGGSLMCATCHVYVDPAFLAKLPEMKPDEDEMLEATVSPRKPNSRLSCQLVLAPDLDGLTVYLPEEQT
jgi:ferredoxin, 2Fe-2S